MCSPSCIQFGEKVLRPADVAGRDVLEVGSYHVNGSLRSIIQGYHPQQYVGVDLCPCDHTRLPCILTPCVDQICDADKLLQEFGPDRFDVVICTEMLEHIEDWKQAIHNLKGVLKPGGTLVLTTRSPGFVRHDFPADYWRFTYNDMQAIFADFAITHIEGDPVMLGIFVSGRKPIGFVECDLAAHEVFSMEKDQYFFYVGALGEKAPPSAKCCGRRFFGRVQEAAAYCDQINQVIGGPTPFFGVVEAHFISETHYKYRFYA